MHEMIGKVANDDQGMEVVTMLRRMLKASNSKYRLRLRGRQPKQGVRSKDHPYSLPLDKADVLALYLVDKTGGWGDQFHENFKRGYGQGFRAGELKTIARIRGALTEVENQVDYYDTAKS